MPFYALQFVGDRYQEKTHKPRYLFYNTALYINKCKSTRKKQFKYWFYGNDNFSTRHFINCLLFALFNIHTTLICTLVSYNVSTKLPTVYKIFCELKITDFEFAVRFMERSCSTDLIFPILPLCFDFSLQIHFCSQQSWIENFF